MGEPAELAGCGGAESLEVAIIVFLSDVEKGTEKIVMSEGDTIASEKWKADLSDLRVGGRIDI